MRRFWVLFGRLVHVGHICAHQQKKTLAFFFGLCVQMPDVHELTERRPRMFYP